MFTDEILTDTVLLDEAIKRLLDEMSGIDCDTEEYAKRVDQLTKLFKMREIEYNYTLKALENYNKQKELADKEKDLAADCELKKIEAALKQKQLDSTRFGLSADTLAIIAANLAGIVLILGYEKVNVVTSKAIGFVSKLK